MLSCSLYLLDINPSWDISFAITWSHPLGGLLILSIVSVQNFFSLIRFCLFFFFCFLCPRRYIQKYIAKTKVKQCTMFPSRCFMIFGLIFVFNPLWIYLHLWSENVVQFDYFVCTCPAFPNTISRKGYFPLYFLASFIIG